MIWFNLKLYGSGLRAPALLFFGGQQDRLFHACAVPGEFVRGATERLDSPVRVGDDAASRGYAEAGDRTFQHVNGSREPRPLLLLVVDVDDGGHEVEDVNEFERCGFFRVEDGLSAKLNRSSGDAHAGGSLGVALENDCLHAGFLERVPAELYVAPGEQEQLRALQECTIFRIERRSDHAAFSNSYSVHRACKDGIELFAVAV